MMLFGPGVVVENGEIERPVVIIAVVNPEWEHAVVVAIVAVAAAPEEGEEPGVMAVAEAERGDWPKKVDLPGIVVGKFALEAENPVHCALLVSVAGVQRPEYFQLVVMRDWVGLGIEKWPESNVGGGGQGEQQRQDRQGASEHR